MTVERHKNKSNRFKGKRKIEFQDHRDRITHLSSRAKAFNPPKNTVAYVPHPESSLLAGRFLFSFSGWDLSALEEKLYCGGHTAHFTVGPCGTGG